MRIINTGNVYRVFDDSLKTYDRFPAQSYIVRFDQMQGFYLEKYTDLEVKEERVYGVHEEKVKKVFDAFQSFERNLGVILSGAKGIGKSLFARMLSIKAVKNGYPLIVVDRFIPGIASYLESIEQEVVVLFDEFDKTFGEVKISENQATPQSSLLSLFDGVSGGKKLFIVTCNELRHLNDFLINRPGRFHYHFRFSYPTSSEIREYLSDKLSEEYYGEIESVVSFAQKVDLNYDCLRAIAFELNRGLKFSDAISDMNIVNTESTPTYRLNLIWENGLSAHCKRQIDLFDPDYEVTAWLADNSGKEFAEVTFCPSDAKFVTELGGYIVPGDCIRMRYDKDDYYKELVEQAEGSQIKYLVLKRQFGRDIHYAA